MVTIQHTIFARNEIYHKSKYNKNKSMSLNFNQALGLRPAHSLLKVRPARIRDLSVSDQGFLPAGVRGLSREKLQLTLGLSDFSPYPCAP